jgi:hypothetical protein
LVFDLSIAHDRFESSSHVLQNGNLTHHQDLDGQLRVAAQRKIMGHNTLTIRTFLSKIPTIIELVLAAAWTASFCVFFFYRLTRRPRRTSLPLECLSSQNDPSDSFRFKRPLAAFYQSLKSKVGLAASKAAALRINLNTQGCGIVAAPVHAPSRAPLLPPLLLSHNIPPPRVR